VNKSESKYFNTALLMDEALLILLEKKDFEFISVKEVCDKAGVNRSTFYLHYENMDDLLKETLELINKKFNDSFETKITNLNFATKDDLFFIKDEYLIPYLNLIRKYKKIFKLIHDKPYLFNNDYARETLYNSLFNKILDIYEVKDEDKEYIFAYYTQGTLAIILKWVEKDCVDSIEKISKLIIEVINYRNENGRNS
jgi:AcrR family transcriptional regulator